jgi:16S rRNA (cytosine967-C5)-methyltransferase
MSASPARRLAREVVSRVRDREGYAHETLDAALKRASLSQEDASLATRLAYGTLQTVGTLDEVLERYLSGKKVEPQVRDALRISAYELLFLHTPPRASVHQGVELVRAFRPQAAGLANAVLRRLADDAADFPWGDPDTDTAALARLHGHPQWLADMWVAELGRDTAIEVMDADNEPAPLYAAHNPFHAPAEDALAVLVGDGADPIACGLPGCYELREASAAVRGRALRDGYVVATDASAQLVARLVRARSGQRVLEVGSGRGTKTLLIQAAAWETGGPAKVFAVDLHDFKAKLLAERMGRYGVTAVATLVGDATDFASIDGAPEPGTIDVALVDAPCTGLGTLRRHPEKRWRVAPEEMASLAELGGKLLAEAARLVRPGGFVVYSTCTVADIENSEVVRAFLASEQGGAFSVDPLTEDVPQEWQRFITDEGFFRSVPVSGGPDGHFAARLKRA